MKFAWVVVVSMGGGLVLLSTEQPDPGDTEDSIKCFLTFGSVILLLHALFLFLMAEDSLC